MAKDFNPRAPCGARRRPLSYCFMLSGISTHAPLAGRDVIIAFYFGTQSQFQPTRPLRGATVGRTAMHCVGSISTHAPLAGRDLSPRSWADSQ